MLDLPQIVWVLEASLIFHAIMALSTRLFTGFAPDIVRSRGRHMLSSRSVTGLTAHVLEAPYLAGMLGPLLVVRTGHMTRPTVQVTRSSHLFERGPRISMGR
jgi:hypothetical protein